MNIDDDDVNAFLDADIEAASPVVRLEEGEFDPRLKFLSHSSCNLLHSCPRKYELYKMRSLPRADISVDFESAVTFGYGTVVGVGVQAILEGKDYEQALFDMYLAWEPELEEEIVRNKKSFWEACFAVQQFSWEYKRSFSEQYELVYWQGKPAVELSFVVELPNGFFYRGFVDVVIRNKVTGEIVILELKTTAMVPNSAMYLNSSQAIGYSVILDKMFPEKSAFSVLYKVYHSSSREFVEFEYEKSLLQRATWLRDVLIDCQVIEVYSNYGNFPQYGNHCYSFSRECDFLGVCDFDNKHLAHPYTEADEAAIEKEKGSYDFYVTFEELLQSQVDKGEL